MKKYFDYPLAVYVATFADGETARLSVGARKGKVDFDRARRLVAHLWREIDLSDASVYWSAPPRADIVAGHVEHDGKIIADPHFAPANVVELPRRRVKADPVDGVLSALDKLSLADLEAIASLVGEMIDERLAA